MIFSMSSHGKKLKKNCVNFQCQVMEKKFTWDYKGGPLGALSRDGKKIFCVNFPCDYMARTEGVD
jgi:hypothetical protein